MNVEPKKLHSDTHDYPNCPLRTGRHRCHSKRNEISYNNQRPPQASDLVVHRRARLLCSSGGFSKNVQKHACEMDRNTALSICVHLAAFHVCSLKEKKLDLGFSGTESYLKKNVNYLMNTRLLVVPRSFLSTRLIRCCILSLSVVQSYPNHTFPALACMRCFSANSHTHHQ